MNTIPVAGNTTPKSTRRSKREPQPQSPSPESAALVIQQNFDSLNAQPPFVEHFTIPGFLRLIDHRWSFDDIRRFGNQAQQLSEAMGLAYVTAIDASLGVLRMFPEKMLRRIYDTMSVQFGWPKIIDMETPALEEEKKRRDGAKANDRAIRQLREVIAETDNVDELEKLNAAVELMERKTAELKAPLATV